MSKRLLVATLLLILCALGAWWLWRSMASTTRIALVNFPGFQSTGIVLSNTDDFIEYEVFEEESEVDRYKGHDCILVFGMGLQWTEETRARLQQMADQGQAIQVLFATSPENNIVGIDSTHSKRILEYYDSGNKKNYQSLARYIRRYIDGKRWFATEPDSVAESASDVYYHIDEEIAIDNITDFEAYLKKAGYWHEGGKKIMMIGGLNDPFSGNKENLDSIIMSLHRAGHNVYPVASFMKRVDFLAEINPDLLLYFPHGRLMMAQPEATVEYLKRRNIPMIAPLTLMQSREQWEADPMGMMGGFMSQTIGMPELDGAIYPYVLNTQETNDDGHQVIRAVPERLKGLTKLINSFLALKDKPNEDKRLAIYFFKAPGQEAMAAQGLETVPSLYNLLKRLRAEGYDLTGLPETLEAFRQQIVSHGQILEPYAKGRHEAFIKSGAPALVSASTLNTWIETSLSPELRTQLVDKYGPAPGDYMSLLRDGDSYLAISRLVYGKVAILPQPIAGIGDDTFAIAHGANTAPPYPYIGAYLWAHHEHRADAMLHFGTHGSLEFTPQKQVALSRLDWADQLVGAMPHYYYYTIGNVGESMMAKRRSYAMLVSYLTPPFTESKTRSTFAQLQTAITKYYETNASEAKDKQSLEVKRLAVAMGVHRELRLDSVLTKPYTDKEVEQIDNFAEEVASEKITGRLYTTGEAYEAERIKSTVVAMAADPIAFGLAKLDQIRTGQREDPTKNRRAFNQRYLHPAQALVGRILGGSQTPEEALRSYAKLTDTEIERARTIVAPPRRRMPPATAPADTTKGAQQGKPMGMGGHPTGIPKEEAKPAGMGGHPAGIPKEGAKPAGMGGHPAGIPKEGAKPTGMGGHPAGIPKEGAKPAGMGGHPAGIPKEGAKPTGMGGHPAGIPKEGASKPGAVLHERNSSMKASSPSRVMGGAKPREVSPQEREWAVAVLEVEEAIKNVTHYAHSLQTSPIAELDALVNALGGGYTAPSSGGDAVANPRAVPTGRNLYSVNAEATPSQRAWSRGVQLVESTLRDYRERHGRYPTKVSYTFWSSEFIESEGTTIAQVLYMLGVEPIRDGFGRVSDLRLIPSAELGRPRIDVVVQTSGQFRDLAASRLDLISRAVAMASQAERGEYDNYVAQGTTNTEQALVEAGMTPREARELSTSRIFGGINGMYGTGIQEMITAGDRWETEEEIANVYLNNMGASYSSTKSWGHFAKPLFRAALANTDVVIQPRQSNTWGALSLDHVYEFMGGMNLTVRVVTGKDPEAYLADYRNRNNARIQGLKEAVGVESRATVLNPIFVKEALEGGASSIGRITEIVTNTYGWEVSKPELIDDELWNDLYDMYIADKHQLGVQARFEALDPVAMQEVTAVMLETIRKGMWRASAEQTATLAKIHVDLTNKYGAYDSGMGGSNTKLQDFIANQAPEQAQTYRSHLRTMQQASGEASATKDGVVMQKQTTTPTDDETTGLNGLLVAGGVLALFVLLLTVLRRRRRHA